MVQGPINYTLLDLKEPSLGKLTPSTAPSAEASGSPNGSPQVPHAAIPTPPRATRHASPPTLPSASSCREFRDPTHMVEGCPACPTRRQRQLPDPHALPRASAYRPLLAGRSPFTPRQRTAAIRVPTPLRWMTASRPASRRSRPCRYRRPGEDTQSAQPQERAVVCDREAWCACMCCNSKPAAKRLRYGQRGLGQSCLLDAQRVDGRRRTLHCAILLEQ